MNRRLLIILVATASVLFVAVLITALVVKLQNPSTPDEVALNITDTATTGDTTRTETSGETSGETANTNETDTPRVVVAPVTTTDRAKINSLAISFTERYGSFSTDTGTENIELLQSFMTDTMQQQADRVGQSNTNGDAKKGDTEFYGISTQSANVDIVDFAEGASGATVEVSTRRTETKGSDDPVIFSQTARIQMTKIGNSWKVDKFQWK